MTSQKPAMIAWAPQPDEALPDVIARNGEFLDPQDRDAREASIVLLNDAASGGRRSSTRGGGWISTWRSGFFGHAVRYVAVRVPAESITHSDRSILLGIRQAHGSLIDATEVTKLIRSVADQTGWAAREDAIQDAARRIELASRPGCLR